MIEPRAWSAAEIAAELRLPPPTDQQIDVIQAPVDQPALVVAGAGSGKTETMAGRVLWLLANRHARPSQVLGLTFTRKAAGELAVRMTDRIAQLVRAGIIDDDDDLDPPQIATYNSYANRLYRDNASAIGREGDGAVLGEAAAWQLARTTVIRSSDLRLLEQDRSLDALTEAVLGIARAIADNVADADAIRGVARDFAGLLELPLGGRSEYAWVADVVENVGQLDLLVDLAEEYAAAKRRRGFVEYSDQVALALDILRAKPALIDEQRAEHRIVLLDEYQDTSVTQAWLLSELYRGHAVMAVGDPNQSIYGWRGASAGNLSAFPRQFGGDARFSLSMSWRNGRRILDVANTLVEPFRLAGGVDVEKLVPRPDAGSEPVGVSFRQTVKEEAETVARWLGEKLTEPRRDGTVATAALLMRARKNQPVFLAALRDRGIRYHVLGVGGLLAEPEVADVVSALSVVHSVDAGMELLRLLAGSRWRVGAADLHYLGALSSVLKSRGIDQRLLPQEVRDRMRNSLAEGERGSIVDALDFLATAKEDRTEWEPFSPLGRERLRDAGQVFARLRTLAGLDLPDFLSAVVHELRLDIEVAANPYRTLGPAPIEALFDALTGYLAVDDVATLGGFLAWLREAEKREDLSPRPEDPEPGTVQVLTIHGAKGLEWDIVAVPRLVEGELPAGTQGARGWVRFGQLPWEFRGDAADLPHMPWRDATTRKEFVDQLSAFEDAVKAHEGAEERRLAYVAATRARTHLLLSGAYWSHVKKPRGPSTFLRELAAAVPPLAPPIPDDPDEQTNPLGDQVDMVRWPFDPLGSRRPAVEQAAAEVRAADPALAGAFEHELEVLLAERQARLTDGAVIQVPTRVSASRFKDYLEDAAGVAESLRRPMPEQPFKATQLGTIFHSWVEGRALDVAASDELDSLVGEIDGEFVGVDADRLAALKATFEASPWAGRRPVEVEREIHLPFDGRIIICKIDAIYADGEGDERTYEVVDWKTGKAPKDDADLRSKRLQLALYRLAYAKWAGVPIELITAAFYFVADDLIIRPDNVESEDELLRRWRAVYGSAAGGGAPDGNAP
ncbi:MAG: ATP-dependent DNA helicase [Pseudolysinimonas sp.]